jgi:hypothetical protein
MRCLLIGTNRACQAGCNSNIVIIKVLDLWIVMVSFVSVGQTGLNGERGRDMGSRDTRNDARKSELLELGQCVTQTLLLVSFWLISQPRQVFGD